MDGRGSAIRGEGFLGAWSGVTSGEHWLGVGGARSAGGGVVMLWWGVLELEVP